MPNTWPTFVETEEHRRIRGAIRATMGCWRRFIIAVDGVDGAGKTNLARYLAWQLGMSAIETDLFFDRENGGLTYHFDRLRSVLEARASLDRPLIIEGFRILQILKDLNLTCDFLVWVEQDGHSGSHRLGAELALYHRSFEPKTKANAMFRRPPDNESECAV